MNPSSAPLSEIRWTARTVLLLGVGVALILIAVTTRNPVPVFAGLPFLVAPVAAAMTGPGAPFRATLAWHTEGSETEVRVRGTVQAEPASRSPDLHLVVERPGDLDGPLVPDLTWRPEGIDFTFEWSAPRPTISVVRPLWSSGRTRRGSSSAWPRGIAPGSWSSDRHRTCYASDRSAWNVPCPSRGRPGRGGSGRAESSSGSEKPSRPTRPD